MRIGIILLFVCVTACSALQAINKVRYDNYKVLRVIPQSEGELQLLKNVEEQWDLLDFWRRPSKVGRAVDIMVSPDQEIALLNTLSEPALQIETWIPNVQTLIDEEAGRVKANLGPGFDYNDYNTYEEISAWMDEFVSSNSGVTKVAVTQTFEGRTVYGLQFKMNLSARKVAYIQGGIHAREWITPASMIYMAKYFADNYGTDNALTSMLDNFIWIIVPVYNIDGYMYSHSDDRMWRKNRNTNGGATCKGVDLNRNFDYEWGGQGASTSKCGETYRGASALSEPENSGMKSFLQGKGDVILFIDFHSYGQLWLHSWGYTGQTKYHPDRAAQKSMADIVVSAIQSKNGKTYTVQESGPEMYPASGGSEDFGYGSLGVKYSYTVELRDNGRYGFLLPANQIQDQADELYEGLVALGQELVSEY